MAADQNIARNAKTAKDRRKLFSKSFKAEKQKTKFQQLLSEPILQFNLRSSAYICGEFFSATIIPSEIHWFQRSAY
jgi:hypothetical protein